MVRVGSETRDNPFEAGTLDYPVRVETSLDHLDEAETLDCLDRAEEPRLHG